VLSLLSTWSVPLAARLICRGASALAPLRRRRSIDRYGDHGRRRPSLSPAASPWRRPGERAPAKTKRRSAICVVGRCDHTDGAGPYASIDDLSGDCWPSRKHEMGTLRASVHGAILYAARLTGAPRGGGGGALGRSLPACPVEWAAGRRAGGCMHAGA